MRSLTFSSLLEPRRLGLAARLALGIVLFASASAAGTARAELFRLVHDDAGLSCVGIQSCDSLGASCAGTGGLERVGDVCVILPNGGMGCANEGTSFLDEVFCCTATDDCGSMGGKTGTCVLGADVAGFGLCDYSLVDYCDLPVDVNESDILNCLADSPSGNALADYYAGDCDGDTVLNGDEAPECICNDATVCPVPPDAGTPVVSDLRGPSFTGAGGCSSVPAAPSALPTLLWLAPLAVALARRRR